MSSELGADSGKNASWSSLYQSDRPRTILGLTVVQASTLSQFLGFVGKDEDGVAKQQFILLYEGTTEPTMTDYAETPLKTIIIAPYLTHSKIFIHKTKSDTAVVGDWEVFTAATVT